jgi:hypothetical protein
MPAESLERRARLLQAMGEDEETRGDLRAAEAQFREASRTTSTLLADKPDDPDRIFDQAQSEYWVATVDFRRAAAHPTSAAKAKAVKGFLAYKRLADRLVALQPKNPKYLRETAYAESNLCTAAILPPHDPAAAVKWCRAALAHMQAACRNLEPGDDIDKDLADRHAWLADAYRISGDYAHARAEREAEEKLLDRMMAADPADADLKDSWVSMQRAFAALDAQEGHPERARARLLQARDAVDRLVALEPANLRWERLRSRIEAELDQLPAN